MDVEKIRNDFPFFSEQDQLVYFDNACSTLKPAKVLDAMSEYDRLYSTCGGRSINRLGEWVTEAVSGSRKSIASFIGASKPEEVVFVRNTTEAINLLAYSLSLSAGDVVLTSDKEHNSNLVPWQQKSLREGIVHQVVGTDADGKLDMEAYQKQLSSGRVKLVAMVWVSNLDGVSFPVSEVVEMAHRHGALVFLDAAQAAPHHDIDVSKLGVDFLAFSGHKLCGPSGIGVLYGKEEAICQLKPFMTGGSTVETATYDNHKLLQYPAMFEAGTQDYSGIIGLSSAVRYVQDIGMENIHEHVTKLNVRATEGLLSIPNLSIIGPATADLRGGILSFNIKNTDIHEIAIVLDRSAGIMVRSGAHCVHSWYHSRDIFGSVRASFYFYNTLSEVDKFVESVESISSLYS